MSLVEKNENNMVEGNSVDDIKHVIKVSANDGAAVSFPIIPKKLGNIPIEVHAQTTSSSDGVERTLLVEVCFKCKLSAGVVKKLSYGRPSDQPLHALLNQRILHVHCKII